MLGLGHLTYTILNSKKESEMSLHADHNGGNLTLCPIYSLVQTNCLFNKPRQP